MSDAPIPRPAALVPRERLVGWRRWRTAELAVGDTAPAEAEADAPDAAAEREAELAALREAARREGHAQGLAEGQAQGHAAGHAQGLAEGHAQGHAAGLADGQADVRAQADALAAVLAQAREAVDGLADDMATALTRLALQVARRVVCDELHVHPEHVRSIVEQVLREQPAERSTGQPAAELFVHPDDADLLASHPPEIGGNHRVVADATIARGGCRLRSRLGEVDATLQERWRNVCATLGEQTPWLSS